MAACRGGTDLGTCGAAAAACGLLLGHHAYAGDCALLDSTFGPDHPAAGGPLWPKAWAVLMLSPAPVMLLISQRPFPGAGVGRGICRHRNRFLAGSIEDDGLAGVVQNAVLQMPSHGAESTMRSSRGPLNQVGYLVAVRHADHVLLDDRAVVQDLGYVVAGGSNQLDTR